MRGAFRTPGFTRLFTGLAASMLGDSVMLLVLSIWVKTLTGSNAMAGLTFFFMVLPAIFAPLLGIWVDRLPARQVLVVGNLLSAVAVLPLVLVRGAGDVWIIWTVALLYGVSFVVLPAALNGLLKDLVPDDRLVDANASLQTTKEGYRLVGPLVGAALFGWLGGWAVALVDAASFVVAAAVIATVPVREHRPERDDEPFWQQLTAGVRFLAGDRVLKHVLVGFGAMVLVVGFLEASIYALLDAFGRPATFAGVLVAVQGVGAVAGGLASSTVVRRLGEVGALVVGMALLAVSVLVGALAPSIAVVMVAMVVVGVGLPLTFVPFMTLVQRRSPRALVGRVSAAVEVLMSTPQAVSLAVGALLVGLLSYRAVFGIVAAAIALGAVWIAVALLGRATAGGPEEQASAAEDVPAAG
ncbi:MAG: MFS transporter [Nocardioides sp.]|nr:MFS transporter [Nocardioides sp.]